MLSIRRLALIAVMALLFAACGSGDDDTSASQDDADTVAPTEEPSAEPTATSEPEPEPDPTATPEPEPTPTPEPEPEPDPTATPEPQPEAPTLPDTPANVAIVDSYDFAGAPPDPALLPAQPGEVTARWYRAGATYAVVYEGLDAGVDACPGNSVFTGSDFEHVSNAELPNASCPDFGTRIENTDTQGVQLCAGVVSYLTLIPSDVAGTFFASIEKPVPEVGGVGLTGMVAIADPAVVPEVDPSALSC